jgi:beta-lactamase regulating signal transducer with metallopeptidase domain
MLDLALRATVLLLIAFAAASVLRRASAAARHLVWASTLVGLLVLPAAVWLGPSLRVTVPGLVSAAPASVPALVAASAAAPDPAPAPIVAPDQITVVHTHVRARARTRARVTAPVDVAVDPPVAVTVDVDPTIAPDVAPALALAPSAAAPGPSLASRVWRARWLIWALGVLAVLGRLLLGIARVGAIVHEAAPVTDPEWTSLVVRVSRRLGIYRRIRLRMGPAGAVPVTCGIIAPLIILPADALGWDDERRALVLTHELAHVRRFDVLTHLLGQCAVALFWFHPLAWIASARMRLERERACDDLVLAAGVRPSRYAGDLLDLVQTLERASAPAVAALAMARPTEIEGRLLAILDAAVRRGPLGAGRIAGALSFIALGVVTIAAVRPVPETAPDTRGATVVILPAVAAAQAQPAVNAVVAAASDVAMPANTVHWSERDIALADIAEAAAGIASDVAKRQVLDEIGQRYGGSDTLRHAFFATVNTMASSSERRRTMLALLGRGSRDEQTVIEIVRSAAQMSSDDDKATVLRTVAGLDPLTDPTLRHEFFNSVTTISSSSDRARVLLAVLGEARARGRTAGRGEAAMIARLTIAAAANLPSTSDKVRVLRAVVGGGWLSDETVSQEFNICLSTLGAGLDYHYIVSHRD